MSGILNKVMFVFKRQRPRERPQELTLNLSESWCLYIFLFLQILELKGKPLQSHNEELKKNAASGKITEVRQGTSLVLLRWLEDALDPCSLNPCKIKGDEDKREGSGSKCIPSHIHHFSY